MLVAGFQIEPSGSGRPREGLELLSSPVVQEKSSQPALAICRLFKFREVESAEYKKGGIKSTSLWRGELSYLQCKGNAMYACYGDR